MNTENINKINKAYAVLSYFVSRIEKYTTPITIKSVFADYNDGVWHAYDIKREFYPVPDMSVMSRTENKYMVNVISVGGNVSVCRKRNTNYVFKTPVGCLTVNNFSMPCINHIWNLLLNRAISQYKEQQTK